MFKKLYTHINKNIYFKLMYLFRSIFLKKTRKPKIIQHKLLKNIINHNDKTLFHKKYNITKKTDIDDFRKKVPIMNYDDYYPYIQKMINNEKNILTKDPLVYFSLTSGSSSGITKYIPQTAFSLQKQTVEMMGAIAFILLELKENNLSFDRGIYFYPTGPDGITNFGVPFGDSSTAGQYLFGKRLKFNSTRVLTFECAKMKYGDPLIYLNWLFALGIENLTYIVGLYPLNLISAYHILQTYALDLINDLEKGTLTDKLNFSEELRISISSFLKPMKNRAAKLMNIYRDKGFLPIKEVWPNLGLLMTGKGGNCKYYIDRLPQYFGDLLIHGPTYISSEGVGGYGFTYKSDEFVFAINSTFFEFIPEEEVDKDNPQTFLLHEIEQGKIYEIVFTLINGLYRYRMGDMIKITGKLNETPTFKLLYRQGIALNVAYEKVLESEIIEVMKKVNEDLKLEIDLFIIGIDRTSELPRYKIAIEKDLGFNEETVNKIIKVFDSLLISLNYGYAECRNGLIDSPFLFTMPVNTIRDYYYNKARSLAQVKIPCASEDEKLWNILDKFQNIDNLKKTVNH